MTERIAGQPKPFVASHVRRKNAADAYHFVQKPSVCSPLNSSSDVTLSRKSSCACGGGCPACQAKSGDLKVSQPNDPAEIEADVVADKVMRMPEQGNIQTKQNSETVAPMFEPKSTVGGGPPADSGITSRINSSRGGGSVLDSSTREFMEGRFGTDLGSVRIHTSSEASNLNRDLSANAFTIGNDIYFKEGEYQPGTESGKHLLAHELTHVAQQKNSENSIKRIQRKPGDNSQESWDDLVKVTIASAQRDAMNARAWEAIRRMLATADGAALINNLWKLSCGKVGSGNCKGRILVKFLDNILAGCGTDREPDGCFQPLAENSFPYSVFVRNILPPPEGEKRETLPGIYGTGPNQVFMKGSDDESRMAGTLFHELLHIEFVNDGLQHLYQTGHEKENLGQIDPEFSRRLQSFENQLGDLENQIHEAAKKQTIESVSPSTDIEEETIPVRPQPTRPLFGGRLSAGGGYAGGGGIGSGFTGVAGADLILERIAGLGLGARGVYLSPDRLLVGPALSGRALEEGDNPLFFDIEAGVLFEIPSSTAGRITNTLAGYASAGFGQEFGRSGARFFWRLGGYVIISDRLDTHTGAGVGGGVTVGAGVTF